MPNKYRNIPTTIDGIKFHSKAEGRRYEDLKLMVYAKEITKLKLQPEFILQDAFTKDGKKYLAIKYKADFKYVEDGKTIVEDVKGFVNKVYAIKKKLLLYKYPNINFREVYY